MCRVCRLYQSELRKAQQASSKLGVGVAIFQALSNLAINGVVLVVVGHGGLLLVTNQVTPGNLMAFLVATQTIQRSVDGWRWAIIRASAYDIVQLMYFRSLASLSLLFGQVIRGLSAGSRVFEFMEQRPQIPLHGGSTLSTHNIQGAISFENVTFAYPTRPDQVQ